jgi:hypothetical protein
MKTCPSCAEQIQDAAIVCRFCNRALASQDPEVAAAARLSKRFTPLTQIAALLVVGGAIAAFAMLIVGSPAGAVTPLSAEARAAVDDAFAKKAYIRPQRLEVNDIGFVVADFEVSDDFLIPKRTFAEDRLLAIREALLPYGYQDYRVNVNGPPPGSGLTRRYGSARYIASGGKVEWVTP